jgi:hypothetical protein
MSSRQPAAVDGKDASVSNAAKAASASSAISGSAASRIVGQIAGSNIQSGRSRFDLWSSSGPLHRASAPPARWITSRTRTLRPAQGCQQ